MAAKSEWDITWIKDDFSAYFVYCNTSILSQRYVLFDMLPVTLCGSALDIQGDTPSLLQSRQEYNKSIWLIWGTVKSLIQNAPDPGI